MTVVSDQILPFGAGKLTQDLFDNVARIQPDAFFYMGNAFEGGAFFQIARDTLGDIPKISGANFMGCSTPDYGFGYSLEDIEGWVGVDQFAPCNPATGEFLDRYGARFGERPEHAYRTQGFDWGMCLAEALGMMRPDNPQALRRALEQVRMMPAVNGSEGTKVSFAPYDHRAYKGSKWVSLSKCENGKVIKID